MGRAVPLLALAALVLTGCGEEPAAPPAAADASPSSVPAPSATPDIARCNAEHVAYPEDPVPSVPVEIPEAFRAFAASSDVEMALLTQSGATVCHSTVGLYRVQNMAWLRGDRLLGWEWEAHEAYGFTVFDRAGKGTVIDTGVRPTFSPSGARFASVEFTEMGFGALGGFAVWEVRADSLAQLGGEVTRVKGQGEDMAITDPAVFTNRFGDWSISGWKGETCVNLSFEGHEPSSDAVSADIATVTRTFHAAESARWQIAPGSCA